MNGANRTITVRAACGETGGSTAAWQRRRRGRTVVLSRGEPDDRDG